MVVSHIAHFETSLVRTSRGAISSVGVCELTLAGLLGYEDGLLIWYARAHAILALLGSLMGHHWGCCWPAGARISIGPGHRLGRNLSGNELRMGARIHLHLGCNHHRIGAAHELWSHERWSHLIWLLHELLVLGIAKRWLHLLARPHEWLLHRLWIVGHLSWRRE